MDQPNKAPKIGIPFTDVDAISAVWGALVSVGVRRISSVVTIGPESLYLLMVRRFVLQRCDKADYERLF